MRSKYHVLINTLLLLEAYVEIRLLEKFCPVDFCQVKYFVPSKILLEAFVEIRLVVQFCPIDF